MIVEKSPYERSLPYQVSGLTAFHYLDGFILDSRQLCLPQHVTR